MDGGRIWQKMPAKNLTQHRHHLHRRSGSVIMRMEYQNHRIDRIDPTCPCRTCAGWSCVNRRPTNSIPLKVAAQRILADPHRRQHRTDQHPGLGGGPLGRPHLRKPALEIVELGAVVLAKAKEATCGWQKLRQEGSIRDRLIGTYVSIGVSEPGRSAWARQGGRPRRRSRGEKGGAKPRHSDQRLHEWRSRFLSSGLTQVAMVEATDQGQLDDFAAVG